MFCSRTLNNLVNKTHQRNLRPIFNNDDRKFNPISYGNMFDKRANYYSLRNTERSVAEK